MLGMQLGPYRIDAELGSGGMGRVWLAEASERCAVPAGTMVAVKVIHPHLLSEPGFFKRFLREAEIGKAIVHPNVVRCHDADAIMLDGTQLNYLVMEYVEGQTLRELLEEMETVPEELCRHVGREVSKGLAAMHAAGVVHRDLKPENVLITPGSEVKVMDLGVARLADEAIRLSRTGAFVGSPQYAAPEQFKGGGEGLDGRADLHALGLILYELSSGLNPYLADDVHQVLRRVLDEKPRRLGEVNPQLSPYFEEVVHCLLAKDREARFGSAAKLLVVLTEGEKSTWWGQRARTLRVETKRPLRRIRIPRETAVYGREDELAKLGALYSRARSGDGQVVLIEGEAGIGKTRLVDELIGRLRRDGEDLNFLFGSYPPGGAATAAGAWSTAYREQFGADGLEETLEEYLTVTPVFIPSFAALLRGEPPPGDEEPLTKDSIQTVFVHVTRALAKERPTVVLIEDLHFAPEEGRALFAALALAVPEQRLMLLGTARPGLPGDWRANLERLDHARRMDLPRLGPKELGRLLIDVFRSETLAEELALRIATKSDGNPFFVFEIVRGLREGQFITKQPDGTWVSTRVIQEIQIPSSVQDLVQARIAELDEEEQEILDVAACCGFEFDPRVVGEALGLRPVRALRRLGHLEKSHRLVRAAGSRFVFDHHQVQEALYAGISDPLREEYHAGIGAVLQARHPEPDDAVAVDLCEHFLRGGRGEKALPHLDAALDHLAAGYQNDQAVTLADRALRAAGLLTGARRAEVLLKSAVRLGLLGKRKRQETVLEEALALAEEDGDPGLRSRAHRAVGWSLWSQSRLEAALEENRVSRDLAREAGDRAGDARATGSLGNVLHSLGRFEEALEHHEHSLAIAVEIGDRDIEARSAGNLGSSLFLLGRNEEARESFERHLAIAREIGHRRSEGTATGNLGSVFWRLGRYEEAREHFERWLAISREIGDRSGEASASGSLGSVLSVLGGSEEALEHHERQLAISREMGARLIEGTALGTIGRIHAARGAADKAKEMIEESLAIFQQIGVRREEGSALHALAGLAREAGDLEVARRRSEAALALRREIADARGIAATLQRLGHILLAEGRHDEAEKRLVQALALGREIEDPETTVYATTGLALLPGADAGPALETYEQHESRLVPGVRMEISFLLHRATGDPARLAEAHRLLTELRDDVPAEYRETMIANSTLHRDIMAAWEEHGGGDGPRDP